MFSVWGLSSAVISLLNEHLFNPDMNFPKRALPLRPREYVVSTNILFSALGRISPHSFKEPNNDAMYLFFVSVGKMNRQMWVSDEVLRH